MKAGIPAIAEKFTSLIIGFNAGWFNGAIQKCQQEWTKMTYWDIMKYYKKDTLTFAADC